jgi:hypothetical protein
MSSTNGNNGGSGSSPSRTFGDKFRDAGSGSNTTSNPGAAGSQAGNMSLNFKLGHGQGSPGEPLRSGTWRVEIDGLESSNRTDASSVFLHVVSFDLPKTSVDAVEIHYMNERVKIAGTVNYGDGTLDIIDTVNPDIAGILNEWFLQVYDPANGTVGFASDYKKIGSLYLYSSKGDLVQTWNLEGIWPKHSPTPSGALDYTNSGEMIKINLELAVDRAILVQTYTASAATSAGAGISRILSNAVRGI